MTKIFKAKMILGAALVVTLSAADKVREQTLQRAIDLMESKGDLAKAVPLFEHAARSSDPAVAARALLYLGEAQERQGTEKARATYQRIVKEFINQTESVAAARRALVRLGSVAEAAKPGDVKLRHIQVADGLKHIGGISRDGQYLSFVDGDELSIMDLATGQKRQVTHNDKAHEHAWSSVFSPDGKQLVFSWHLDDNQELRTINIDGTGQRTLFRADPNGFIQTRGWAGDTILILISSGDRDSREHRILAISPTGGSVRTLKTLPGEPPQLTLSPDGRWVAVNHRVSNHESPSLVSTAAAAEVPLFKPSADYKSVAGWTPDGKAVLFTEGSNMKLNLYALRIENGHAVGEPVLMIPNSPLVGEPVGVTRQGSLYYTSRGANNLNVFAAAIDPGTCKIQSEPVLATSLSIGDNWSSSWTSDGSKLAYTTNRSSLHREFAVAILDEATGHVREISPHLYPLQTLQWSPDGKALLTLGPSPNGRMGVFSIDARTAQATPIALSESPSVLLLDPVFTPDGRSILYRKAEPNNVAILLKHLDDGRTREVFHSTLRPSSAAVSPDGTRVAFLMAKSLMVLPISGGESRTILTLKEEESFQNLLGLAWMPDGKRLLFSKQPSSTSSPFSPTTVWSVSVDGGEPQTTGLTMKNGLQGLSVHPSGRRIGFSSASFTASDKTELWVVEGFAGLP